MISRPPQAPNCAVLAPTAKRTNQLADPFPKFDGTKGNTAAVRGTDVALALAAVALATFGWPGVAPFVPLTISEVVPLPERRSLAIREPIKCGSDGHIYVQFYASF